MKLPIRVCAVTYSKMNDCSCKTDGLIEPM